MMKQLILSVVIIVILSFATNAQPTWIRCSAGLPDSTILSLTIVGEVLFAGTDKAGVYRSTDGGSSWIPTPHNNRMLQTQTWCMAAIDTFVFAGQRGGGIFRNSLNGSEWVEVNNGLTKKFVQDLIAVENRLYVATYGGGIFTSSNLGESWTPFIDNAGMNDRFVYSLAHTSTHLYAGTAGVITGTDTGVFYRIRFGDTAWEAINSGFILNGAHLEQVFALDATNESVLAGTDDVGLFRLDSESNQWEQVDLPKGDIHAIKIIGGRVLYGTSHGGCYRSDDGGKTFMANNIGLTYAATSLPSLIKDFLVQGNTIYAATAIGVFKQPISTSSSFTEDQLGLSTIRVQPNPATSTISITQGRLPKNSRNIILLNSIGQVVRTVVIPTGQVPITISVADIPSGPYFLRFDNALLFIPWIKAESLIVLSSAKKEQQPWILYLLSILNNNTGTTATAVVPVL